MSDIANCSIEHFNFLGLAHADKNNNGKIDKDEQSIFDEYMKRFDKNNNGKLDEEDAQLFQESITLSDEEQKARNRMDEIDEAYGTSKMKQDDYAKLPAGVRKELADLIKKLPNNEKMWAMYTYAKEYSEAFEYFGNLKTFIKQDLIHKFNFLEDMWFNGEI